MKDSVLITGVTGQAGSYLSDLLVNDNIVYGLARRVSTDNTERIKHLLNHENFYLLEGDITDFGCMSEIITTKRPKIIYNTAAQSHVQTSFEQPGLTWDVTAKGVLNILEILRLFSPTTRFVQFSSSEMFGSHASYDKKLGRYQNEVTEMQPQSPYAIAKLAGYHLTKLYRKSYNLFATNAILFNYESPRRGTKFVTRKVTQYVAELYHDVKKNNGNLSKDCPPLKLGNISAVRDWGHAKDYMRGVILAANYHYPEDFVFATGDTYTVKDFVHEAFKCVNLDMFIDSLLYHNCEEFMRPADVLFLKGKATKAKTVLSWKPEYDFRKLVEEMVWQDILRKG